jgi:hypothetical protein
LRHRLGREAAILAGLAGAPVSTGGLVAMLYAGLDPKLRPAAEASVTAHLLKLAAEGRAEAHDGMWRAI